MCIWSCHLSLTPWRALLFSHCHLSPSSLSSLSLTLTLAIHMGYPSFPNPLIRHAAPPTFTCIITHSLTHDLAFLFTLGIPRFSRSTYLSPLSRFVIPLILSPSLFNPLPQAPSRRFIIPYRLSINAWHWHLNPQEGPKPGNAPRHPSEGTQTSKSTANLLLETY